MILIKWFNYKKIVLKFPILCGYWRYHLIFFHPPRARVFLFRFLINEFCELVAHFPELSETFSVKAVVQTVKLLACITGAVWTTQGNAECACYTHWMAECGNKHPGLLHIIARNSKGIMAAVDGALKWSKGNDLKSGAPNDNFRKISVRKTIWGLEFSEHLL